MGAGLTVAALIVTAYNPHWSEKKAMPNQHLADAAAAQDAVEKGKAAAISSGSSDDSGPVSDMKK
jgi:hypothetical protein